MSFRKKHYQTLQTLLIGRQFRPLGYLLGGVQVLDVVDVYVPQQDEALDVVRVVLDQLVEEGRRLEGSLVVRQE